MTAERTLSRRELTVALAARQLLLERARLDPAEAIRRLSPLQGQERRAPYLALAARLEGFAIADLEAALTRGAVVKTTIMRQTLHLAATDEYPAYARLVGDAQLRLWRRKHPATDEERIAADLRAWLAEPRSNAEIRERLATHDELFAQDLWTPILYARNLLPLVQTPHAALWADRRRPTFVLDPRPLPEPAEAAELVLARYLAAFGPASRRDAAAWAKVPQAAFEQAWDRLELVRFRDENGTELFDLPDQPLPPASTPLPVRFLAHWDQPLLAHADRERILPAEVRPVRITLSGDCSVTVDGRVAATWRTEVDEDVARIHITPHTDIPRSALAEVRAEAERIGRFAEPGADAVEVVVG